MLELSYQKMPSLPTLRSGGVTATRDVQKLESNRSMSALSPTVVHLDVEVENPAIVKIFLQLLFPEDKDLL